MTDIPADELKALGNVLANVPGVCELGNKKNSTGLYREWYEAQGLSYQCIDWNGEDGAAPVDMRQELDTLELQLLRAPHDLVTNFGFTEHVDNQLVCWKNIHSLVRHQGWLVFCMPQMPYWRGHGLWQPTLLWYKEFAALNGYCIELLEEYPRVRPTIIGRFKKVTDSPFRMPKIEIPHAGGKK